MCFSFEMAAVLKFLKPGVTTFFCNQRVVNLRREHFDSMSSAHLCVDGAKSLRACYSFDLSDVLLTILPKGILVFERTSVLIFL